MFYALLLVSVLANGEIRTETIGPYFQADCERMLAVATTARKNLTFPHVERCSLIEKPEDWAAKQRAAH